jgi:NAD(P)-dependent dehydrogenase (short-subunit alcohol dehydrogenase family)
MNIVEELLKLDYIVVGVGRRYGRWVETLQEKCPCVSITENRNLLGLRSSENSQEKDSFIYDAIKDGKLHWLKADVRIHREIERTIEEVKKVYGTIDLAVNISVINKDTDYLKDAISTARDGEDIYIRLPGAYKPEYIGRYGLYRNGSPGSEHSLFTNLVGIINLNKVEKENGVKLIINPDQVDELTNALTKKLTELDPDGTITLNLREGDILIDYINKMISSK